MATVGFAAQADAALITYTFAGVGTGQIGGVSFTDKLVVFTGTGQTEAIEPIFGGLFDAIALQSLTVTIDTVGTATLLEPAGIFSSPTAVPDDIDTDDEIPDMPFVLLGRLDSPPDLEGFTGMAATASNALAGYHLATSIGPVVGFGGVGFIDQCSEPFHDPCLATSMGLLRFTHNILEDAESNGTFTAVTRDVPEPASMFLMAGGLAAFVRRSRRRGRTARAGRA